MPSVSQPGNSGMSAPSWGVTPGVGVGVGVGIGEYSFIGGGGGATVGVRQGWGSDASAPGGDIRHVPQGWSGMVQAGAKPENGVHQHMMSSAGGGDMDGKKATMQSAPSQKPPLQSAPSQKPSVPHSGIEDPPPVSMLRDEKLRQLLGHVSRHADPVFKSVLVNSLLRWIDRANLRRNRHLESEIPWKNLSMSPDPLLPSDDVGCFLEVLQRHLRSGGGSGRMYEAAVSQFAQMCTAMAFEVVNAREWHRQQLRGEPWTDQTFGLQSIQRPSSFNGRTEVDITWRNGSATIWKKHFDELSRLYHGFHHTHSQLLGRIFNMVQRYETMNGLRTEHQRVLPPQVFQSICDVFEVTHECFASPMNRRLDSYCSQFPDTDRFFNSSGSFYDYLPSTGSFVAHPPPVQQDVVQTFLHIASLLQSSNKPLSFFVFAPVFDGFEPGRDTTAGPFIVRSAVVQRNNHMLSMGAFFRGTNSSQPLQESMFVSNTDSACYWLQNAAGRQKWPVTDMKVSQVLSAFLPSR